MRPAPPPRARPTAAPSRTGLLAMGLVALGPVLGGCGGGATGGADLAAPSACALDSRSQTYVAGMMQPGMRGLYDVKLVTAAPAPPQKDDNTWTVQVLDKGGTPVEGATLVVTPFMPDHGHGSPLKVGVTAKGSGTYQLTPVYLHMAGMWRVTVTVLPAGGTGDGGSSDAGALASDQASFYFCVEG